jgi:competence protein ComEC
MAGLVLIARATGRTYDILRALIFAGVGMLLINPYLLAFDPGFQLSFLATLGLIFCAPLIDARLSRVPSAFGIREFLTATLATQLFVLPLLLYSMGMFSGVSVVANVLVLPMVPFAMLFTFLTGVLGLILPLLGTIAGFGAYLTLTYIVKIAELLGTVPFAAFTVPTFPFWVVLVSYGVLILILAKISRSNETVLVKTVNHTDDREKQNMYADWTIEEEIENPRESQSVSRGSYTVG